MPVVVYAVRFGGNAQYVGLTKNLERRIEEHSHHQSSSTKRLKGDPVLIYCSKPFESYAEPRHHEKFLKSGAGRKWLKSVRA